MIYSCNGKCIESIKLLDNSILNSLIINFISSLDINDQSNLNKKVNNFYNFIKFKYRIKCEVGMLFIEAMFIHKLFDEFKIAHNNLLVEEKIKLYRFIKPEHLKISVDSVKLDKIVSSFNNLSVSNIPSCKIYYIMNAFQTIFDILGKDIEYDQMLSIVIYSIIKADLKDMYNQIKLIKHFKRSYVDKCIVDCCHGFNIDINCDCLKSDDYSGEEEYYIITCEAAIEYIEKMEYSNLNISIKEYNKHIDL